MGLFKKELNDYKVMERYKKGLDDFYEIGETEKYRIFLDKRFNQYIMRQEKQSPKKVVYLGWLRGEFCVFHGRIFYIKNLSYTGHSENPLNYIDIETGDSGRISVLSNKGCWLAMHWHCQDVVNKFSIQKDVLVIEVTRYKEKVHDVKEFSYSVYVTYANGQFRINRSSFESQVKEQENCQETEKDINRKTSLLYSNDSVVRKSGLTYGDDIVLQAKDVQMDVSKATYDVQTVACGLVELAIKELLDLMEICTRENVTYDERKLVIATFSYYYEVWLFNFESLTIKQAEEIEEVYKEKFKDFNREKYEEDSYKSVLENEIQFEQMLRDVDRKIRTSYHNNSKTFLDDGLTDSFILSFVNNLEDSCKIKGSIVSKVFEEWVYKAQQAEKLIVIE